MNSKIGILILFGLLVGILIFASIFVQRYNTNMYMDNQEIGNLEIKKDDENISGDNNLIINSEEKSGEENKMGIIELTSENFKTEVLENKGTVLIDFYADWCGPCKMMTPVIEKIAEENPSLKVGKVNVDEQESLAIQYQVMSIPTFMVVKNGEVVDKIIGAVDKATLEEIIK